MFASEVLFVRLQIAIRPPLMYTFSAFSPARRWSHCCFVALATHSVALKQDMMKGGRARCSVALNETLQTSSSSLHTSVQADHDMHQACICGMPQHSSVHAKSQCLGCFAESTLTPGRVTSSVSTRASSAWYLGSKAAVYLFCIQAIKPSSQILLSADPTLHGVHI